MQFSLFLAVTMLTMTIADDVNKLIDFAKVAACAPRCHVLQAGQQDCKALTHPFNGTDYIDCFCNFPPLEHISSGVDVCSEYCDIGEQDRILTEFIRLCYIPTYVENHKPVPHGITNRPDLSSSTLVDGATTAQEPIPSTIVDIPEQSTSLSGITTAPGSQSDVASSSLSEPIVISTSLPLPSVPTSSSPMTSASASSPLLPPASLRLTSTPTSSLGPASSSLSEASTASSEAAAPTSSPPKDHGAKLYGNKPFFVVLGVFLSIGLVISIVTFYFVNSRGGRASESDDEGNGAILLQSLPRSASHSRPTTNGSEVGHAPTMPASPLEHSSFGETLRGYARQEQEREAAFRARREAGLVPSWRLPRQQGTSGGE